MRPTLKAPRKPRLPRRPRLPLALAGGYALYFAAVWFVARWLTSGGLGLWLFRILFWLLGLIAIALILWFRKTARRDAADSETGAGEKEEIDDTVAAAQARLARSPQTAGASLRTLPVVAVIGPPGSTKTTAVVRSGLDPDLLAGEVFRGNLICATNGVNLWYSGGSVLLEAAGSVSAKGSSWARVLKHIQPERLGPVVFGRPQASRQAVVCFGCDEFLKPGASESVPAAARALRARLSEMTQTLGVQLPVYVLFTKADKIRFFADYVRNFQENEIQEVLGTTLRLQSGERGAAFAEQQFRLLNESMQRLFRGLAERRLQVLAREGASEVKSGAYEFPREFRRVTELASRFLVELCKPSQLSVNPFLRGYYFTGVRAVIVSDPGASQTPDYAAPSPGYAATQVFESGGGYQQPPASVGGTSRKVPQWLFLNRVFRDVILKDRIARAVTEYGARVDAMRRWGLVGAATIFFLLSIALTVSFGRNRGLQARTLEAARDLRGEVSREPAAPDRRALLALDDLRSEVAKLGEYERNGRPLSLRWGLYSGDAVYPEARLTYLAKLNELLLDPTRQRLETSLARLPASPGLNDEFDPPFNELKTYLMVTSHTEKIDSSYLGDQLHSHWRSDRSIEAEREQLAGLQFAFFSGPLCRGEEVEGEHPCGAAPNERVVEHAQKYLGQFNAMDRLYAELTDEISAAQRPVQFNVDFPGTADVVENGYVVPGAFTQPGWEAIMARLEAGIGELQDDWVLGGSAPTAEDRAVLRLDLRNRYKREYTHRWLTYLTSTRVPRYGGLQDASTKLRQLSANESPLLQLLWLASSHTDTDSMSVGKEFQPVHIVVDPGATDRYLNDLNKEYVNSLVDLQLFVSDAAGARDPESKNRAIADANGKANQARAAVARLAQAFRVEGRAREVGEIARKLLETPIENTERHLTREDPRRRIIAELNAAGRRFCSSGGAVLRAYPFRAGATNEARLDDVIAAFDRATGQLWMFYNQSLSSLLQPQGPRYGPTGGNPAPSSQFVDFFNRSAQVSSALWPNDATEPRIDFVLLLSTTSAMPRVTLSIDGDAHTWTQTARTQRRFRWIGKDAREVRLSGQIAGAEATLIRYDGTWAVFKFFRDAKWQRVGREYQLTWDLRDRGVRLEGRLNLGDAPAVFDPAFFQGLTCVSRVVG